AQHMNPRPANIKTHITPPATNQQPHPIKHNTHSHYPKTRHPQNKTQNPKTSTMLPNSVTVDEKSISKAIVAALMNFIVIIEVRNTAIFASPVTPSNSGAR